MPPGSMAEGNPRHGKVVFVSSLRGWGGGERWMLDAAAGLQSRGHEVRLVARPGSALAARAPSRRISCLPVDMRSAVDPVAVNRLSAFFRRFRPDAVCPNLDREIRLCAMALGVAGRLRGHPPRTRLVPRRGSEFPIKNRWHYRLVYRRAVRRVIVNSRATRDTMCSGAPWFTPEDTRVIYNGIRFDEYDALAPERDSLRMALRERIGAREHAPVVALIGELNERKGQHLLIDAMPRVLAAHPDAHAVFVGEGDARSRIAAAVRAAGIDRAVHLLGFRDDVPAILTSVDILALPSTVEGFGYVLVEAMAAGIPVVASNTSSIPEIVENGKTGHLHDVGDVRAIADCLIALTDAPGDARAMGAEGRRVAHERFSEDRMLDELEDEYFA